MEKEEMAANILGVIAFRRTDLYEYTVRELEELDEEERERIKSVIRDMRNERFLTEKEIEENKINPEKTIEDLEIDFSILLENLGFEDHIDDE